MDNLNETIETLKTQFELLKQKDTRANKTAVRKSLQSLKNKCHSLRKEILGKPNKIAVEPVEPPETPVELVAPVEPVEPEPVSSHPVPESQPAPVVEEVKPTKKRKKTKKSLVSSG